MTISELQKALQGLDPNTYVVAYKESENGTEFFEIVDAEVSRGTPKRHSDGSVGFTFSSDGPEKWLLMTIEQP